MRKITTPSTGFKDFGRFTDAVWAVYDFAWYKLRIAQYPQMKTNE